VLSIAVAVAACQIIGGITDKELDPAYRVDAAATVDAGGAYERRPPARPAGAAVPSDAGSSRTFVVRTYFLGTIDPATRKKDPSAWRRLGFDIDGRCTTAEQSRSDNSGVCKKPAGSQELSLEDGEACRDNSVGRLVSAGNQWLSEDFEQTVHARMNTGLSPSLMLHIADLDDGPDDPYAPGVLYVTAPRAPGQPPLWNGSDEFAVDTQSVLDGGLDRPRYEFPKGYLKGNVWVSGDFNQTSLTLPMMFFTRFIEVQVSSVTFMLELDAPHATALRAVLAAAIPIDQAMKQFAPVFYEAVGCSKSLTDTLLNSVVKPNADLGAAAPDFVTPDKPCEVISVGFALEWVPTKAPAAVVAVPATAGTCDGGYGAGPP
jgi:hypothetical protein